jgi:uncharacterized protein with GYD domain
MILYSSAGAEEGRDNKYPKLESGILFFVMLAKDKVKPTKENTGQATKILGEMKKQGIKVMGFYWTLGRYDDIIIFEAPSEKDAMKLAIAVKEYVNSETLVAIPREDALKLL